jgi:hypothetical protein
MTPQPDPQPDGSPQHLQTQQQQHVCSAADNGAFEAVPRLSIALSSVRSRACAGE